MSFTTRQLDRVTGYHGYLRDLTVSELKRLDASSGFRGLYGKNEIPTLREFLELVAPTELIVNMELKNNRQYYPRLEEKVIALVRAFGMEKRVIFSSFNNVSILRCRRLAPEIDAGFLWKGPVIGQAGQYCRDNDVQFFMPDGNYLSDDIVADFRAHGIRLARGRRTHCPRSGALRTGTSTASTRTTRTCANKPILKEKPL